MADLDLILTPAERPGLTINGVRYEYLDIDDHSPRELNKLNRMYQTLVDLEALDELTDEQAEVYESTLEEIIKHAIPNLPEEIRTSPTMRRSMKLDIAWDFLEKQQKANPRAARMLIATMMRRLPEGAIDTQLLMQSLISAGITGQTPMASDGPTPPSETSK